MAHAVGRSHKTFSQFSLAASSVALASARAAVGVAACAWRPGHEQTLGRLGFEGAEACVEMGVDRKKRACARRFGIGVRSFVSPTSCFLLTPVQPGCVEMVSAAVALAPYRFFCTRVASIQDDRVAC